MFAPDSIDLLHKSGLDFARHSDIGIDPNHFAELLITSGLVLCEDVKWISFHRCVPFRSVRYHHVYTQSSGYDFGYLVKLLTCSSLPVNEDDFFKALSLWFPTVYDVKLMMRACKSLKGGLQDVADDLGVRN